MSVIATALKHLMAAGVTGDDLVAAIADIENSLGLHFNKQVIDEQAERRRAKDRERVAIKRASRKMSADSPQTSADSADTPPNGFPDLSLTPQSLSKEKPPKGGKKKGPFSYPAEFESFWQAYPPNNGLKAKAYECYQRVTNFGVDHDRLIAAATAYGRLLQATSAGREFTKHAATWLNGRGWETDYEAAITDARRNTGKPQSPLRAAARDDRDPAKRARDEADRINAEREARWAAEDAAIARQEGPATPNAIAITDLRQPDDLRGQSSDDCRQGCNVSDGTGRLPDFGDPPGIYGACETLPKLADTPRYSSDYRPFPEAYV